jgi:hypothetical protein
MAASVTMTVSACLPIGRVSTSERGSGNLGGYGAWVPPRPTECPAGREDMTAPDLAFLDLHGLTPVLGGLVLLALSYLNWRYIEALTRDHFGEKRAKRLAKSPIGNKIGGTIFLVVVGSLMVVGGSVQALR